MLLTTTTLDEQKIRDYLGLVSGVAYAGGFLLSTRALRRALQRSLAEALEQMRARAMEKGADAVVGIQVEIQPAWPGSTFVVIVLGTAVKLVF